MRIETHNLTGEGDRRCHVWDMPPEPRDYWAAVTDVACPAACGGLVRWAEAGYVPGYRICDRCGRHYQAQGTAAAPTLVRVGSRSSSV